MDFDLDNVPDIEPVPLPVVPSDRNVTYTAKEILGKSILTGLRITKKGWKLYEKVIVERPDCSNNSSNNLRL